MSNQIKHCYEFPGRCEECNEYGMGSHVLLDPKDAHCCNVEGCLTEEQIKHKKHSAALNARIKELRVTNINQLKKIDEREKEIADLDLWLGQTLALGATEQVRKQFSAFHERFLERLKKEREEDG